MHHPFKERQYAPLSSGSLGENLHILKWKCKVPLKKTSSRQAGSCPLALAPGALYLQSWWWWERGHGDMLRDAPKDAGPGLPAVRGPAVWASSWGARRHSWKRKRGNQVKPRLGFPSPAHTLLPLLAQVSDVGSFCWLWSQPRHFFFPYWSYKLRMS